MGCPAWTYSNAYQEADGLLVQALIDAKVSGIVLAGMGAGGAGGEMGAALGQAHKQGIKVVSTTRTGAGRVIRTKGHVQNGIIAGDNLSAQKARILLRLALTATDDDAEIQRMFYTY